MMHDMFWESLHMESAIYSKTVDYFYQYKKKKNSKDDKELLSPTSYKKKPTQKNSKDSEEFLFLTSYVKQKKKESSVRECLDCSTLFQTSLKHYQE